MNESVWRSFADSPRLAVTAMLPWKSRGVSKQFRKTHRRPKLSSGPSQYLEMWVTFLSCFRKTSPLFWLKHPPSPCYLLIGGYGTFTKTKRTLQPLHIGEDNHMQLSGWSCPHPSLQVRLHAVILHLSILDPNSSVPPNPNPLFPPPTAHSGNYVKG